MDDEQRRRIKAILSGDEDYYEEQLMRSLQMVRAEAKAREEREWQQTKQDLKDSIKNTVRNFFRRVVR